MAVGGVVSALTLAAFLLAQGRQQGESGLVRKRTSGGAYYKTCSLVPKQTPGHYRMRGSLVSVLWSHLSVVKHIYLLLEDDHFIDIG